MKNLYVRDLNGYLKPNNILGVGTEGVIYNYGEDRLIKLFHVNRKSPFEKISDQGLIKLTNLDLTCFSKPIDIIYEEDRKIIGYVKENIKEEKLDINNINFDEIKKDVELLSENGYRMEDIFYNYIYANDGIHFTDISSFKYLEPKNDYIKNICYKHNLQVINTFLIGLLEFDAFRQNEYVEYTKLYKVYEYRKDNSIDSYYGDYVKANKKIG